MVGKSNTEAERLLEYIRALEWKIHKMDFERAFEDLKNDHRYTEIKHLNDPTCMTLSN